MDCDMSPGSPSSSRDAGVDATVSMRALIILRALFVSVAQDGHRKTLASGSLFGARIASTSSVGVMLATRALREADRHAEMLVDLRRTLRAHVAAAHRLSVSERRARLVAAPAASPEKMRS